METGREDLLRQLNKLSLSEQEAKTKVEELEAQIQALQDTITELHQEMSLKDQDKLRQLQQLVQLETRVKELTQEVSAALTITRDGALSNSVLHRDVSGDQAAERRLELLKNELTHRDASIQKLQRDLLLSHQARDSQSAQLDVQEQRLWELQRELQEKQQELRRRHNRLQQLSAELQSTTRNTQELQGQLREARTRLVQVESENESLLGYKRLQKSERENGDEQETQRKFTELQAELSVTRARLSDSQDGNQEVQKRADEQIQQLQEEVSRLKLEHRCVNQQLQERSVELSSLQKSHADLQVRDKACQRELTRMREELHSATLRAEEQRLKEVQIDELQHEVDRMLALLEKEREDGSPAEESEWLRGERLRLNDQLVKREDSIAALTLEADSLRQKVRTRDQEVADLCQQLVVSQDAVRRVTGELRSCQRELRGLETQRGGGQEQREVELKAELKQLQCRYSSCYSQLMEEEGLVSNLRTELQQAEEERDSLEHQLHLLTEKHHTAQQELEAQLQEVQSKAKGVVTLEEEVRRLLKLLKEKEEMREEEKQQNVQLRLEQETLHTQLSRKEAALRTQDSALTRLKAELMEAQSRLQPISESLQLYKQKYQRCMSKISELESTLQNHEDERRRSRAQAVEREEQVARLQAETAVLRDDVEARCTQLESGDEALTTLSRRLRDTQRELERSHAHAQECELVIDTLRDDVATLHRQAEEAALKLQSDFSLYKATHMHSESDFQSQMRRIGELEQALSQAMERSESCHAQLETLKEEAQAQKQLRGEGLAEVRRLQELIRTLQAEAVCEAQSRQTIVGALELRVTELEEQLEAAQRQCVQKKQAVQKRDALLKQSEVDLVQAREKIRGKAAEAERHVAAVQTLHTDLRQARKEKREKEKECGKLHTQLLQIREELKENRSSCRDGAQALARYEEKVVLLEAGHQKLQEQLTERVAEGVRAEQTQRRLQAELRSVQQSLDNSEQELQDCRNQLEQVKLEASSSRQALLSAQQEALRLQQENQELQDEQRITKESFTHMQEQLRERSVSTQALRLELAQEQARQQEQLDWVQRTRQREDSLKTERDQLRTDLESVKNETRAFEMRLVELSSQLGCAQLWGQQQLVTLESREEELVLLKVEVASLRENYRSKVAQLESLHTELDSVEEKYRAAVSEVEILKQALADARTDSSRLHRESELVVTNVDQWVKEQKQANEKLGLKIREQSKKIIHLTAEKDHLQESVEKLQAEIRTLRVELDEQRTETERHKAFRSPSVNEPSGRQPPALLGMLSHQRENTSRKQHVASRLDRS